MSNAYLIRRLLALAWVYRWGCLRTLLFALALDGLGLLGLGFTGLAVGVIKHAVVPDSPPPRWPLGLPPPEAWTPMAQIQAIAAGILLLALVRGLLQYLGGLAQTRFVQDMVMQLRARVYAKLQSLSFRFFDAHQTSSIINRVAGDTQRVRSFVDGVIVQVSVTLVFLAMSLSFMLSIHVRLTLVCLATTPLLWLLSVLFSRTVRPAYYQNRRLFDDLILTLSENIQGMHVVKGFGRQQEEIAKFGARNRLVRDQQKRIFWITSLFTPAMGYLTQINLAVLLAYGGYLVITYEREYAAALAAGLVKPGQPLAGATGIDFGTGLVVFAGLLQQFSSRVGNIANIANSLQQSLTSAERVFEVLDAPVEIRSPAQPTPLQRARGRVTFENVTFGYKPDDPVLHGVSFDVQPGMCVAVLGPTGSGKTTLLSLIPRFYDPQQGRVLIDTLDVRQIDLDHLRRNIGLVFQESFLFSDTVAGNIAFGNPRASRAQVEKAARIAAAHDFIAEMSQGYDTVLREGGTNLSGGQRQRLAIARAILLEPSILLLDDPTAAIDPQTEHEIMAAMESAMQGRTTFVVAHRLSTLRRADLVIVLDQGRIVQSGTHEQLMAEGGVYRRAVRLQIADAESLALLGLEEGDL